MITITTSKKELLARAESVMTEEALNNPDVGNVQYVIQMGDFDSVDFPQSEITAVQLFNAIFCCESE